MSGYVVLLNLQGELISPALLREMTESMAFRGPDAQRFHLERSIGFGHTLLRTTYESANEQQPLTLDEQVWIVADARVDGRSDLIARFPAEERFGLSTAPDAELILRSYLKWGEGCIENLIGDFSFAIWDGRTRRLFCARDHFGVKPFYYSHVGNNLIVSNTLNCIRLHPAVSDRLNDQAVGDFLLVGSNETPGTTFFADISRLPAAHKLSCQDGSLTSRRYWTLPIDQEIRYKRDSDYIENFIELLDKSVEDRLRTDRVAVFMSGGIDSTTIAATAHKILSRNVGMFDMQAFTVIYERLIPDDERYYSSLVAENLKIPINYTVADKFSLYSEYSDGKIHDPEPVFEPLSGIGDDQNRRVAKSFRVALTGQGGDVILRPSVSYIFKLFKNLEFGRAGNEIIRHVLQNRRLPRIGLRSRIRQWMGRNNWYADYPIWLSKDFEEKLNLRERWKQLTSKTPPVHPYRPEAYGLINTLFWSNLFEEYDPGHTNQPFESRHPLFDLRLVGYSMRMPSLPWCIDKKLMRESMIGRLPDEVLQRQKAPVSGDPVIERIKNGEPYPVNKLSSFELTKRYVDWDMIAHNYKDQSKLGQLWTDMHPVSLNYWLQREYINLTENQYELTRQTKV